MIARQSTCVALAVCLVSASLAQASVLNLDLIAGVYKHRFENGDISGNKYESEDVLEIVKLQPTKAYFRVRLEFFNGHSCGAWGIATTERNSLVFRDRDHPATKCVLRMSVGSKRITFSDADGNCRQYCGMRGSFEGESFDRSARRPIRYLKRIFDSQQFKESVGN
jgi:hypothetical protein